jgi:hypothetical protein
MKMDTLRQHYPNYDRDLERVHRFWSGDSSERCIISVQSNEQAYRQLFDDDEIIRRAPFNLKHQASLPGLNLPTFFNDFGTISTAKYWGGLAHFDSTGGNIFIEPAAQTVAEALAITPHPVNDPTMDLARGLSLYRRVRAELNTEILWMRTPDMQGPLNTAGLVMNQENLLIAMHDDKAQVHALLEKVTEFLIELYNEAVSQANGQVCGSIWPYTLFPASAGISFTEDLMPLLSARLYKTFGIPCLQRMAEAAGGLHIHCCGDWGRHARNLAEAGLPIRAVEFHYPETKIEELEPLSEQVVLVPYILLHKTDAFETTTAYYRYLLDTYGHKRRFWFACTEDSEEMRQFAENYGF